MKQDNRVKTPIGYLWGRDSIYVDSFRQKGNFIEIVGEFNGELCSENPNDSEWFKYSLKFQNVMVYRREELELYSLEKWKTESNFSIIEKSDWMEEYGLDKQRFKFYILETYDDVYFIICESYSLEITGER